MIALMAACAVAATVHTQAQGVDAPAGVHAAR
jgi:hypothetical protein